MSDLEVRDVTAPAEVVPEAAQATVDRLGCSLAFVRLHWGPHACLDGQRYVSRCVVVDPARHEELLALLVPPSSRV